MKVYIENNVITKVEDNLFVQSSNNYDTLYLHLDDDTNIIPTITFKRPDGRSLGPFLLQCNGVDEETSNKIYVYELNKVITRCKGELEIAIAYNHYSVDENDNRAFVSKQTFGSVIATVKGSLEIPTDEMAYYEEVLENLSQQVANFVNINSAATRTDNAFQSLLENGLTQLKDINNNILTIVTTADAVTTEDGSNVQEFINNQDEYNAQNDLTLREQVKTNLAVQEQFKDKLSNNILDYPVATSISNSDYVLSYINNQWVRVQKNLIAEAGTASDVVVEKNNRGTFDTLEEANTTITDAVIGDFVYIDQEDKAPIQAIYDKDTGLFVFGGSDYYLLKETFDAFIETYNKDNEEYNLRLNEKMKTSDYVENELIKEDKLNLTETNKAIESKASKEILFNEEGKINEGLYEKTNIDNFVEKEEGKELSTNDFTDEYKNKVDNPTEVPYYTHSYTIASGSSNWTNFFTYLEKLCVDNGYVRIEFTTSRSTTALFYPSYSTYYPFIDMGGMDALSRNITTIGYRDTTFAIFGDWYTEFDRYDTLGTHTVCGIYAFNTVITPYTWYATIKGFKGKEVTA